jgi:hypothetical protein
VGVLDARGELPAESGVVLGVQVHLVGGAADPGPHRLIRRVTLEIVFAEDGHLCCDRGLHAGDGRDRRPTAAAVHASIRGAKRGANVGRRQATSGDNQP